jgi:hypothetical protein
MLTQSLPKVGLAARKGRRDADIQQYLALYLNAPSHIEVGREFAEIPAVNSRFRWYRGWPHS